MRSCRRGARSALRRIPPRPAAPRRAPSATAPAPTASRRPETSMSQRVLFTGRPQIAAVVVGPEGVLKDELRVGRLPQHVVTGPLLTRGPQQQIHVGNVGAMQVPGDGLLVHPLGVQLARS